MVLNISVCDVVIDDRVLVGAPRAQTGQPKVIRGGSVFRCDTNAQNNENCQAILFDASGNVHLHLFYSAVSTSH